MSHSQGARRGLCDGVIDFTAGSIGGGAQVYVSQPLDTVKVKLQTFPSLYRSTLDCLVQTYKKDGIARGLYAGSVPAVLANVAENSVLFAAYGACQKMVSVVLDAESPDQMSTSGHALAGFCAAFFSSFTLCPTELVKCRLQALRETAFIQKDMPPVSTWSITRYIYRKHGFPGFFRGLTSTLAREMPGYFFFFGSYELTREFFRQPGKSKDDIGALRTMIAGAVGGSMLWLAIFPIDSIKSRIQVNNITEGMLSVGMKIIRNEGFPVLYNGLLPTILRTIPATATLFVTYEFVKKSLHRHRPEAVDGHA